MNTEALPPFVDAFPWTVVRVATYMPAHGARSRLLFGSVSLLTPDRAKPVSSMGVDRCRVKPIRANVFVRQVIMGAAEALAWYRGEGGVDFRTPVPAESGEINEKDGQPIKSEIFADNPEWPQLAVPLAEGLFGPDSGDPAPFMGSVPSRLHRRFGDGEGFEAVTADAEAVLFLKHRLHIDLAEYPEYLGGLALVVPDPVIQRIDSFLIPSLGSEPEKVMRRLVARTGQSLEGLRITILEKRTNLLSRFETYDVPADGVVVAPQKLPTEESGYLVTHPDHGVLVYGAPATFIRSVHLNMGIVGRIVTVQAPKTDSPTSAVDPYQVWEIAKESPVIVGQGAVIPGTARVAEAEARRKRRAQARRYDQTWFEDESRHTALAFIRTHIGRARRSVLVADPYS
ncbi:MAG: VPA1262 family N-terminal domain-containing protein [Acidiferrobacter sp.]